MTEETNSPTTDAPPGSDSLRLTILESITDAFFALDGEWRFTYVNRQAERLLRRGREELLGRGIWDEFPEAVGTTFHEQYRRAAREQVSVTFDEHYPPLAKWFEVRAYPSPEGLSVYFHDVTERREAERRLRESEERYRTLFNSIDEGFCVVEVLFDAGGRADDYRFLEVNPSFEKLTGIPADAALSGRTVRELVPNLEDAWFETYGRVALTGAAERFVSGSEAMGRWFDVYAFRVGGDDSRKVAILFNNITERVRAEESLRGAVAEAEGSRRRLEAVFQAVGDGIAVCDMDGRFLFANQAQARINGYASPEEMSRDMAYFAGVYELAEPGGRVLPVEEWPVSKVLRGQSVADWELRGRRRDTGREWHFSFSGEPVRDERGRQVMAVIVTRDVTGRKQAEEEARRATERAAFFSRVMEDSSQPFASGYTDGRLMFVNRAFAELVGYTEDELSSLKWTVDLTPEEWRGKEAGALAALHATGEPQLYEKEYVRKDGGRLPVEIKVHLLRDERGGASLYYVFVTDIGGRKRAEREREELLGREQAARQRAEEANRLKDEFLATVSHELRTPLTAILGWAHMLEKSDPDDETLRRALEVIRRNAEQQRQIVEDILDVSRVITGQLRLEHERVELATVVRAALDTVGPSAEAKGVRLRSTFDHGAAVSGDPARLQQAVWNLLSNAVKFTPAGGEVRLEVTRLPAHVIIEVGDTGHGIAPEFLPHVFDRFRQADGSTTRRHGGLGLGLSIVRHLVEAHGGSVHAASEGVGRGATFTIELPPAPEGDAAARQAGAAPFVEAGAEGGETRAEAGGDDARRAAAGLRVLLVDDDDDTLEMLSTFLRRGGAEVTTAGSAGEALAALGRQRPDVIVADIGMPEVDGYELMRRVRALGEGLGGRTPAVALTAYASEADRDRALRVGFQEHLAKPAEPEQLLRVITRLANGVEGF